MAECPSDWRSERVRHDTCRPQKWVAGAGGLLHTDHRTLVEKQTPVYYSNLLLLVQYMQQ